MKSIQGKNKNHGKSSKRARCLCLFAIGSLLFLTFSSGCGNKFFDPTQVGRFRPVPAVSVILDSLGVAEETSVAWERGEEPRPSDTMVMETDYVFRSGDIVRVSIFELLLQGVDYAGEYVVTETGKISIPDVGVIEAGGLTETQLEEEIRQILSPSILKEPSVVVTLLASQQRTFSVLGVGIPAPGRYAIPRYDFRLNEALATAGGHRQFNVSYIYVARTQNGQGAEVAPDLDMQFFEPGMTVPGIERFDTLEQEMIEVITPRAKSSRWPASRVVIASAEMGTFGDVGRPNVGNSFGAAGSGDQGLTSPSVTAPDTGTSVAREMWEEPAETEQVTVGDILKTLSERSRRGTTTEPTNAADTLTPGVSPVRSRTMEAPASDIATSEVMGAGAGAGTMRNGQPDLQTPVVDNGPTDLDEIMRTLSQRSRPEPTEKRVGITGAAGSARPITPTQRQRTDGGPTSVDDILRTMEEKSGVQKPDESTDWDAVLESLAQPGPGREEAEETMDFDELLKSFAEPEQGEIIDEQIDVGSVDLGVDLGVDPGSDFDLDVGLDVVAPRVKPVGPEVGAAGVAEEPGRIEWVFQDGKWVPMQVGLPTLTRPVIRVEPQQVVPGPSQEQPIGRIEWTAGAGAGMRLIRIPTDKLMSGDPRYNIVIQPGDSIYVPVDVIGEFCIMGNVNRQGYIPITGRPLTLKMAIAAAGGLGPLAWPKRCEVVRRIGRKKEEIVMVDLEKIANGEQPDFFIKPNDLINVGTHATSRWLAILRNSFRATYGFGFLYDRNFADRDFGNSPLPF